MRNMHFFTADELDLSAEIISHIIRSTAMDISFLQRALYSLKPEPTNEISSICSDYEYLYYNPKWVIKLYSENKGQLRNSVIHTVLHCLYLHPSMISESDKVFDIASDYAVFCMMNSGNLLKASPSVNNDIEKFMDKYKVSTTAELYKLAESDMKAFNNMSCTVAKLKEDDHKLWYTGRDNERRQPKETAAEMPAAEENIKHKEAVLSKIHENEKNWTGLLEYTKTLARSEGYGSRHGKMFMDIQPPDRFSRFSYMEYIRRFAIQEIISEDPDTFDMIMYTWGMDNLGDTPLIEFSEVREQCSATDIMIAIDMSGSCGGDIAVNFLRQIYTLFAQMDIRSAVNIHVVTFDTQITDTKIIRCRRDADELVKHYKGKGWGGTNFTCVFDYADKFRNKHHGRKLKGLFFFSDAFGQFPREKPTYKTTFFIPSDGTHDLNSPFYKNIPKWVELVHYNDE